LLVMRILRGYSYQYSEKYHIQGCARGHSGGGLSGMLDCERSSSRLLMTMGGRTTYLGSSTRNCNGVLVGVKRRTPDQEPLGEYMPYRFLDLLKATAPKIFKTGSSCDCHANFGRGR